MKMLPLAIGMIAVIASLTYVVAEPYLQTFPAKLFTVQLSRSAGGLGSTVGYKYNISEIGTASLTVLDKSRLESMPPLHSYLVMQAGGMTSYAVVFWTSGPGGTGVTSFSKLPVLVSSLSDNVTFYYSVQGADNVNLGTYQ